ncbi:MULTISPECIES: flavin-containing monooxygenase [Bacillaceae]|uniref:NAD(P)/FAD-dependent oxidoreductase n=1 Tax=Evansella alkalicola TaxID=745819 RepID=A0ABS6JUT4_9BACI|nr:NAD(P)/FAD-dependent oxidoreductase [Litchfieldia alkalitelluris]MBU9722338.1 NAD(P)/FAD-dependent oxidoreductase [Bacillus alkalicola]
MKYDIVVIGAGQAGLSMGYYLKQTDFSFLIIDKNDEIGEVWSNRYDSLKLFTPNAYNNLPGLDIGNNLDAYPTKDDIAYYLKRYVQHFSLPVQLSTEVLSVCPNEIGFKIVTDQGELEAKNIVVATGPFQSPFIPDFANELSKDVLQLHSSQYKNSNQLIDGPVLVVGGGNSGAQIAVELAEEREVYLSVGQKIRYLPQNLFSKSIFSWFDKLGILSVDAESKLGQFIKKKPDPIFGYELKSLIKNGKVMVRPRTRSANNTNIEFEDGNHLKVTNIIWSTGFHADYSWLKIDDLFHEKGIPKHQRGITDIRGLYFLGLPWQYRRGSALLQGVGYDAKYIFQHLIKHY